MEARTGFTSSTGPSPVTSESRDELLQSEAEYDTNAYSLENILRHYWLLSDREEDNSGTQFSQSHTSSASKDTATKWTLKHNQRQTSHNDLASFHRMLFDDDDELNNTLSTISEEDVNELLDSFDMYSSSADTGAKTDCVKQCDAGLHNDEVPSPVSENTPMTTIASSSDQDLSEAHLQTISPVKQSCIKHGNTDNCPSQTGECSEFQVESQESKNTDSSSLILPRALESAEEVPQRQLRAPKLFDLSSSIFPHTLESTEEVPQPQLKAPKLADMRSSPRTQTPEGSTRRSRAFENISRFFFSDYYPFTFDFIKSHVSSEGDDSSGSEDGFLSIVSSQCTFSSPDCTSCEGYDSDRSSFEHVSPKKRTDTRIDGVVDKSNLTNTNIVNSVGDTLGGDSGTLEDLQVSTDPITILANNVENQHPSESQSLSITNDDIDADSELNFIFPAKLIGNWYCAHAKSSAVARYLEKLPSDTMDQTCATSYVDVNANSPNEFLAISRSALNAAKLATLKLAQKSDVDQHRSEDIEVVLTTTCVVRRNDFEIVEDGKLPIMDLACCSTPIDDSMYDPNLNSIAAPKYVYKKAPCIKDVSKHVSRSEETNTDPLSLEFSDISASVIHNEKCNESETDLSGALDTQCFPISDNRPPPDKSDDFFAQNTESKKESGKMHADNVMQNGHSVDVSKDKCFAISGEARIKTLIRQNASKKRGEKRGENTNVKVTNTNSPILKCNSLQVSFGDTSLDTDDFGEHYYADVSDVLDEVVYTKSIDTSFVEHRKHLTTDSTRPSSVNYRHANILNKHKTRSLITNDSLPQDCLNIYTNTKLNTDTNPDGLQSKGQPFDSSSSDTLDTFISVQSSTDSFYDSRRSYDLYDMSPGQKRKFISSSWGPHEKFESSRNENIPSNARRRFSKISSEGSTNVSSPDCNSNQKISNGQLASILCRTESSDISFFSENSSHDATSLFPENMMDSLLGITAIMSLTNGLSRLNPSKATVSDPSLSKSSTTGAKQSMSSTRPTGANNLHTVIEEAEYVSKSAQPNEHKPSQRMKHAHLQKVKHMFRIFHLSHDDDQRNNSQKEKKSKEK